MKKLFIALTIGFIAMMAKAQTDYIMLRDGSEMAVKLYQINDTKLVYSLEPKKKNSTRVDIPTTEVYMVYIDGQGNMYFDISGKRRTGEPKRVDRRKNDIVYLVNGGEIAAENIRFTDNEVRFDVDTRRGKKKAIEEQSLPKEKVWMVLYRSGMQDIVTPIEIAKPKVEPKVQTQIDPEPVTATSIEDEYIQIFHTVKPGDNLQNLAVKYGVTPQQIKEWNDLPAKQKVTSPMKLGIQLMIYTPKIMQ